MAAMLKNLIFFPEKKYNPLKLDTSVKFVIHPMVNALHLIASTIFAFYAKKKCIKLSIQLFNIDNAFNICLTRKLCFASDNQFILAKTSCAYKLIDIKSKKCVWSRPLEFNLIGFCPGSKNCILSDIDNSCIKIINIDSEQIIKQIPIHAISTIHDLYYSPDERKIAVVYTNKIIIYDADTGNCILTINTEYSKLKYCLVFSTNSRYVAVLQHKSVNIWDILIGEQVFQNRAKSNIESVCFCKYALSNDHHIVPQLHGILGK
jgi:hypothetical protein